MTRMISGGSTLALAVALLAGCPARTTIQKAGTDQEITTQIMWKFREDPRLEDVIVTCLNGVVTLKGRVDDKAAAQEAVRIASSISGGAQIMLQIQVRRK